ncbi:MAG: molybdenum cofactor guanylyltransferase [Acidimicrobiales bacterium]
MDVAAMVLTGGASRRMGRCKATLPIGWTTLAARTAALVATIAEPVVEVGPGHSGAPFVMDALPAAGPLAAIATGLAWLGGQGWTGPVIVVATDLPCLSVEFLAHLAAHPAPGSVVPLDAGGRPQPLCARYSPGDLATAQMLVASGQRAMSVLLEAVTDIAYVDVTGWAAAEPDVLVDADTPDDWAALVGPGVVDK